jgi:hypothetical protein
MQVVLLRVGIDSGCGGIHGPLFQDGGFEFIPIPDGWRIDRRTYGNTKGRRGQLLVDYFPKLRQSKVADQSIHFDPEFTTYTYGDPTPPKSSLRKLAKGDLLIFYSGLEGWDFACKPALYLIGYFVVSRAGIASNFSAQQLRRVFGKNFHVRHHAVLADQRQRLVLVKGGTGSRLLRKAVRISWRGKNCDGRPLHRLSKDMQRIFGDFDGHTSIERSPPRWVSPALTKAAAQFVLGLD